MAKKRAKARATKATTTPRKRARLAKPATAGGGGGPRLLTGGNPQIAKADGDAPVQAFIAAMPGWKRDIGRRLDTLIGDTLPKVRKAVRWNTPFYGAVDRDDWFLAFNCCARYVKVAFFRGTLLSPVPPVESKQKEVRYYHIHENEPLDAEQLAKWIRQASKLPGEPLFKCSAAKR